MFGLGFGEIVIILVLALILLGPKRLPDVAKQLGKGLRDFRRATDDLKQQFESELYSEEARTAPRPTLVPPTPSAPKEPHPQPAAPPATVENAPGLEAALAEPARPADPAAAPQAAVVPPTPNQPVKPA